MWLLGINPRSSAGATTAPNPWAVSPALLWYFSDVYIHLCGLNGNGPSIGWYVWIFCPQLGRIKRCGLAGRCMAQGWTFKFQKPILFPVSSLCLALVNQDINFQLLLQSHAYLLVAMWAPNKLSLLIIALIMVSYHRKRKVTRTGRK